MDAEGQSPRRQTPQTSNYSRNVSSLKPGKGGRLFNERGRGRRDYKEKRNPSYSTSNEPVPTLLLKSRFGDDRSKSPAVSSSSISGIPSTSIKRDYESAVTYQTGMKSTVEVANPFTALLPSLKSTVKLLDDNLEFSDRLQEFLLDQPDFLVVAVVGLQGTGKSTILSAIAREDISLNDIFPRSSKEQLLISEASTLGIDVFVSSNRVIYLDCQPFLSTALANTEINNPGELFKDSYISYEPPSIETSMEIKALQLLAFVMCVCHHLILVQDWMFDTNLIRLIYIAEMLKPAIPGFEDQYEHYPNLIVVHNKVEGDAAGPASIKLLQESYSDCFQKTRLAFSNSNGFFQGRISDHSVNLVLLPSFGNADMTSDCVPFSFLEAFDEEIRKMREQLFCLPWEGLTLNALTEKNWLYYAGKVWDTVRKSSLIMEYSRLL